MRLASSWLPLLAFVAAALLVHGAAPHVAGLVRAPGDSAVADAPAHHVIALDVVAVDCPPGYDNGIERDDGLVDDVCLSYGGAIPGPTWLFHEGDDVTLTLTNRIAETVANTSAPDAVKAELATAAVSLHRHGIAVAASDDGVPHLEGTRLVNSSVAPNATITYRFSTPFPGAWHYHDHVLGQYMSEGKKRGLYGAFMVLPRGEETAHVLDLHVSDMGVHHGLGFGGNVTAGERFDIVVTGLGNFWWSVALEDPSGRVVGRVTDIGPGVSRPLTVLDAEPGTYTWTARSPFFRDAFTGEVVAS